MLWVVSPEGSGELKGISDFDLFFKKINELTKEGEAINLGGMLGGKSMFGFYHAEMIINEYKEKGWELVRLDLEGALL
jgi:hypothetical protein